MKWHQILDILFPITNPLPQVPPSALADHLATKPKPDKTPANWVYSALHYRDPDVKTLILHMKKYQDERVAQALASQLHDVLLEIEADYFHFHGCRETVLIPIPPHRDKKRQRGFNQSQVIARHLEQGHNHRTLRNALHMTVSKPKQATLSRQERIANMQGAFTKSTSARFRKDQIIVLVDDVTTTGATLNEARLQLIHDAPLHNIIAITVAH